MAFQIKAKESVHDGILRNVRHQIEKVLGYLDAKTKSRKQDAWENEAIFEARKSFKKVRAALRLVREDLGEDMYHEENYCFRDAARPLTEVRDAHVLVETFGKLTEKSTDQTNSAEYAKVHGTLFTNLKEVTQRVIREDKVFTALKEFATRALVRLSNWTFDRDGWIAVESGIKRVYKEGHRALSRATENPSVENLHEWRKQAKYLWHQLQLLDPIWSVSEKELGDQFHKLTRLLGEDHDLAVLRQTLAADPLTYGGHLFLKGLFVLIDQQRKDFQKQAFTLGRQLYKDSPKIFTSRIETYWNAWQMKSQEPTKSVGRSQGVVPIRVAR